MNKDEMRENMSPEDMSKNLQDLINGGDIDRVICNCGNAFFCGVQGEMNPGMIGCIPIGCPEPTVHTIACGSATVNTYHCDCGEVIVGQVLPEFGDECGMCVPMNQSLRINEEVRVWNKK